MKELESSTRKRAGGATMVELLLALPVLLLLGLGIVQYTLVYQAKHALDYALTQAARQGAVDHASVAAIEQGLAVGLAPYLYGAADWAQLLEAEVRALAHIKEGAASGWIRLRQRSPSQESFDDWAEPALDAFGEIIPGEVEIANDNLDSRRLRMQPASGTAGLHLSEPIGQRSGQSLADANLLRLELVYGIRLIVPVVGGLLIRTLSVWNGCSAGQAPRLNSGDDGERPAQPPQRLGLLMLGPVKALEETRPWMCDFLQTGSGRIPLRLSATMRMMSPARRSHMTQARTSVASGLSLAPDRLLEPTEGNSEGGSSRGSSEGSAAADGPRPIRSGSRAGDNTASSGKPMQSPRSNLANGFLSIGADRPYGMTRGHPALCPS